jgi:hypothetical protein
MDATEKKWNLATRQWDSFDNYAAQVEAIRADGSTPEPVSGRASQR